MNKKAGLLLFLVAPLTACNFSTGAFSWKSYKNDNLSMELQSAKFKNYKLYNKGKTKVEELMREIQNIVANKESASKFNIAFLNLNNEAINVIRSYIIASTKYYANSNQEYNEISNELYSIYTDVVQFMYNIGKDIYYSSDELKKAYFGDISDEEMLRSISQNEGFALQSEYDVTFTDYKDEGMELYNQFLNSGDLDSYLDAGYDYFIRYINKANELVNLLKIKGFNYDNYLDYAYDYYYSRDYTYQDAMVFVNYVKEYLVPLWSNDVSLLPSSSVNKDLLNTFKRYNFCNSQFDASELFESYAKELGGKFLNAYNGAFKNGYYCFSSSNNSLSTAFQWGIPGTNESVLYFSKNYQDILSVIHEFGHYYSNHASNGARSNDAYDLQETYSQANEFTFMNYVLTQKKDDSDLSTYKYIADNMYFSQVGSIINEACITEIENFAYTTPKLSKEDLKAGVEEIINSYEGAASPTYFMAPCLTNPCYYVSYATSLMEASQFLYMNFEDAKVNYKKLIEADDDMTMVERWKNASLESPFEKSTFETIAENINEIALDY